jgi:Leucine-rich repeat (LRR) protein
MPSCEFCTRVACRGGFQCTSFQKLNIAKISAAAYLIERLDLSGLHLKSLPRDYFRGLEHVYHVDLSNNDFEDLQWWTLEHLTNLWSLRITNNPRLKTVSDAVRNVAYTLGTLYIDNCPLIGHDTWLFGVPFPKLTSLHISNCGLKCVGRFRQAPVLELLNFAGNTIRTIRPDAFANLHRLKWLDLSENRLAQFDPACLSPTSRLIRLILNNNRISKLPSLGSFPAMTELYKINLSNNRIHHLCPGTFNGLVGSTDIDLSNNYLTYLDAGVFQFQFVTLDGNLGLFYIDPDCFGPYGEVIATNNPLLSCEGGGPHFLDRLLGAQAELIATLKKSRFLTFHEDLIATVFHPSRIEKLITAHGLEALDAF